MRSELVQGFKLAALALVLVLWTGLISAASREITVCRKGCNYDNLSDAVRAASPGDTIVIDGLVPVKGVVVIDKDLAIKGVDENAAIIPLVVGTDFATTWLLDITAGTVKIENLTLQPEVWVSLSWPKFCPTVLRVRGTANVTLQNVKAWTRAGPLEDRGGIEVLDSATLEMTNCSIVSDGNKAALKIGGSPKVGLTNCSIRTILNKDVGVWIEGGSPTVTIKGSTIRQEGEAPIDVAIHVEDLGSSGAVTISGNRGKTTETVAGALRITGAIGGSIEVINSQANVRIGGDNPADGNDIVGRSHDRAGIAIRSSQNVTIQNNFIGYFGQKREHFSYTPGIRISGDDTVVTISSNEIIGNGGCGVLVESRGATVKGSGNSIYLNCVSSICQEKLEFKKCGANLCPCPGDYDWPPGFGGGA